MKTASGGDVQEFQLFITIENMEYMQIIDKMFSVETMPGDIWKLYADSVISNTSEMWTYQPQMSLFSNGGK
jgi:hypothetical protein